jgi:hypothetical protein
MNRLLLALLAIPFIDSCRTESFTGVGKRAVALPPVQTKEFTQDAFEPRQVQLKQGVSGAKGDENYAVTAKGVVDIVVVVDNSGSMAEEQANLSSRMLPLLSSLKDADWRIVVTTTDPNSKCGYGPISKGDFFAETRFKSYVKAGTDGTGIERPILQAVAALKSDCFFGPGKWLRPGSTVAVVILTDEDNCHIDVARGYGCAGEPDKDGAYLTSYLSSIRKIGTEARVYGIFWHPSVMQSQCPTALKSANILADVVQSSGGTWGSICDSDYSATLTKISTDVAQILKADFALKSIPDAGTFKMTVNGQPWTDFSQTGVNVHFTKNPPVGGSIKVSYLSGSAGLVGNSFDMPEVPAGGLVTGTILGQPAGAVTYDGAAKKVVFAQNPPDGSVITLSYKKEVPLRKVFTISLDANRQYLNVYVSGVLVAPSTYNYNDKTGEITFTVAPPESAPIKVEWRGTKVST